MKILLVTDAWHPQVNGVVRTLDHVCRELDAMGHRCVTITPQSFRTIPCPTYREIRLSLLPGLKMGRLIDQAQPDAIHIATEGPLGLAARRACLRRGLPFTTAYHTKFPEYIHARLRIPLSISYRFMRWFHRPSHGVMVATASMRRELEGWGLTNLKVWNRGVDVDLFRPRPKQFLSDPRPIALYVGRVAVEKNIDAFLSLNLEGTQYVVGDGPQLDALRRKYPAVRFVGAKQGETLAQYYAASDVFVFPSRTDTFGLVLLEALASGVPVAAYPVPGPIDVINDRSAGCLDEDLGRAVRVALTLNPERCRAHALTYSWKACGELFIQNLSPIESQRKALPAQAH